MESRAEQKQPMYIRLRNYIDSAGVSRKQLALNLKKSESYVSLILSGNRKISIDEYEAICRVLSVSPIKFFE